MIPEPTLLYGLRSQRAYALAGESGVEVVTPKSKGVSQGITINISNLAIREQADVMRVAREMQRQLRNKERALGVT